MFPGEIGQANYFSGDVVLPHDPGRAIKVGDYISDNGAYTWRDIEGQITKRGVGSNDPTWSQIGATVFYAYKFALLDEIWMHYHIPHDFLPGSAVHFHAHWIPDGTATENVTWEWTYAYAKGMGQEAFAFGSPSTVTATQAATGTQYSHMVTESIAQMDGVITEPDGGIYARIRRISNEQSPVADNTDGIFVTTFDVHYQSTNIGTKQKAPGFYDE